MSRAVFHLELQSECVETYEMPVALATLAGDFVRDTEIAPPLGPARHARFGGAYGCRDVVVPVASVTHLVRSPQLRRPKRTLNRLAHTRQDCRSLPSKLFLREGDELFKRLRRH